jgi:hypothetical protein
LVPGALETVLADGEDDGESKVMPRTATIAAANRTATVV